MANLRIDHLNKRYGAATVLNDVNLSIEAGEVAPLERVRTHDRAMGRLVELGRAVDRQAVQAVFLSGLGMPTVSILDTLEQDLGKPVISAASATMWQALRLAGVRHCVSGYGRLLMSDPA